MNVQTQIDKTSPGATEHFDVLIVGAGISGVGAAYHLTHAMPGHELRVLETQDSFGGTWITHAIRASAPTATCTPSATASSRGSARRSPRAEEIRKYMGEVIEENDLGRHIRYRHTHHVGELVERRTNLWTIEATRTDTGEKLRFTTNFLWMCQGYYRHSEGYTPEWPGMAEFKGPIVHPQTWPRISTTRASACVVIGSGATAATLVPAMADDAAHVTMLQRSPTYFRTGRNAIEIAEELRELQVDETWIHEIVRRKILYEQDEFTTRVPSRSRRR